MKWKYKFYGTNVLSTQPDICTLLKVQLLPQRSQKICMPRHIWYLSKSDLLSHCNHWDHWNGTLHFVPAGESICQSQSFSANCTFITLEEQRHPFATHLPTVSHQAGHVLSLRGRPVVALDDFFWSIHSEGKYYKLIYCSRDKPIVATQVKYTAVFLWWHVSLYTNTPHIDLCLSVFG